MQGVDARAAFVRTPVPDLFDDPLVLKDERLQACPTARVQRKLHKGERGDTAYQYCALVKPKKNKMVAVRNVEKRFKEKPCQSKLYEQICAKTTDGSSTMHRSAR